MVNQKNILILGSAPDAIRAAHWQKSPNWQIVAINNAWKIRKDWDYLVHAGDFPTERMPVQISPNQEIHTYPS